MALIFIVIVEANCSENNIKERRLSVHALLQCMPIAIRKNMERDGFEGCSVVFCCSGIGRSFIVYDRCVASIASGV